MKIKLEDLELAVNWIIENTNTATVDVETDGKKLFLGCLDKQDRSVNIELFCTEGHMMPKIVKTEILRKKSGE